MTKFESNKFSAGLTRLFSVAALVLLLAPVAAHAPRLTAKPMAHCRSTFNLTASEGYISVADGASIYSWGYARGINNATMQLPGPTLIVTPGRLSSR